VRTFRAPPHCGVPGDGKPYPNVAIGTDW
jgi:hypothetical protein